MDSSEVLPPPPGLLNAHHFARAGFVGEPSGSRTPSEFELMQASPADRVNGRSFLTWTQLVPWVKLGRSSLPAPGHSPTSRLHIHLVMLSDSTVMQGLVGILG